MLPLMRQHIAESVDSMTTFMLLQHEAAIANLLEVGLTDPAMLPVPVLLSSAHGLHLCAL